MEQIRNGKEDDDQLNFSNSFYEARVFIRVFYKYPLEKVNDLKFKVTQNGKEIPTMMILPTRIQYTRPGVLFTLAGFILYILTDDVVPDVPVEILTIGDTEKGLKIKFTNKSSMDYTPKEDSFKWRIETSSTRDGWINEKM